MTPKNWNRSAIVPLLCLCAGAFFATALSAQGVDLDEDVDVECMEGSEPVYDEDLESWFCAETSDDDVSETSADTEPDLSCLEDHTPEYDEITGSWYCAWRGDVPEIDCADNQVAVFEDSSWSCKDPSPPNMNVKISCDDSSVPRWDGISESWACEDAEPCEVCEDWAQACGFEISYQARLCEMQMEGIARNRCLPKRGGKEPGRDRTGNAIELGEGVTCQQDPSSGYHSCEGEKIEACVATYRDFNPDVSDTKGSEHGFNYNVGISGDFKPEGVGVGGEIGGGGSHSWNSSQTISFAGTEGYQKGCRKAAEAAEADLCQAYVKSCLERHQCVPLD